MKRTIIVFLALMLIITFTFNGAYADEIESAEPASENTSSDQSVTETGDVSGDKASDQIIEEPEAEIVKPARQVIRSLQPGNRKLTVQWTPDPDENARYEIWIATDSRFTESLIKVTRKAPKDMVTKVKLVNGMKYYVKVRTYYQVDDKKYNGRWSRVRSVTVKKTAVYSNTSITGIPEVRTVKEKDDGDLLVLVNKYHVVGSGYHPENMVRIPASYGIYSNMKMKKFAFKAYKKMLKAAKAQGLNFKICSAYRSQSTQRYLFNNYIRTRGYKTAFMLSAYPGRSEHHTGLAMDLLTDRNGWGLDKNFANTKEGEWLQKHCAEYGFIIRYPKGKEMITGYQYEPWHFRYVGKKIAKEIMEEGITLEEYLGKTP